MSREKPYRSKAPQAVFNLMQEALGCTFYLVHEAGPTSFLLKDERGKQIKVQLGSRHTCSCGGGAREHCIHTLYVLLKIFRVLPDNPLAWQLSFIDSEITWLIRNRVAPASAKPKKLDKKETIPRLSLEEEFGCSICQEDMKSTQSLVHCKVGCGHNFHVKCMKVWANHKLSKRENLTCPLCRSDWGPNAITELDRISRQQRSIKLPVHKDSVCEGCNMYPIKGSRFRCLYCHNCDLCKACFYSTHFHHPFIKKISPKSKWDPAPRIASEDSEFDTKKLSFENYVVEWMEITEFGGCVFCKEHKATRLRLLNCSHSAHEECLLTKLKEGAFGCPEDLKSLVPGLPGRELPLSVAGKQVTGPPVRRRVGSNRVPSAPRPQEQLPSLIVTPLQPRRTTLLNSAQMLLNM